MKQLWIILLKEVRDNLRDRRSLFFSLFFGPVLMPLLMIGPIVMQVNKHIAGFEQSRELHVRGIGNAPNLVRYLSTRNLDAVDADDGYVERIRAGDLDLVLEIPADFSEAFSAGQPASLIIHYNSSGNDSKKQREHLKAILNDYAAQIGSLRYLARGIDERIFNPLSVGERDVSGGSENSIIGRMLTFLLLMSMMMGGLYLAVDTTAGERERLSLEPLLALPVGRSTIVLGKYAAILLFVLVSLILPLIISYILFGFLSGGPVNAHDIPMRTFLFAGILHLPAALLFASLLLLIAAFTRSTKEAQTIVGFVMVLPMLPFFILQFMDIPSQSVAMAAIPLLSQYQIMGQLVAGEPVETLYYVLSLAGPFILALLLLAGSIWFYNREGILR